MGIPIEARLSQLAVMILYNVCRVQKFDAPMLNVFNDAFIDRLFELVEVTRDVQDETANYCLIKLIVRPDLFGVSSSSLIVYLGRVERAIHGCYPSAKQGYQG